MSPDDGFDAFYRQSRDNLLTQVYAYAGDAETAGRSLSDAYASARRRWRRLRDDPDKEAWIRSRAFRASERANRRRQPWWIAARQTADHNRALLTRLHTLEPATRHLLISHELTGHPVAAAAREAGMTPAAAERGLDDAMRLLAPVSPPDRLVDDLRALAGDLSAVSVSSSSELRRAAGRRRLSLTIVAGLAIVAIAIAGRAFLTGSRPTTDVTTTPPDVTTTPPDTSTPTVDRPPPPLFSDADLAGAGVAALIDSGQTWRVTSTTAGADPTLLDPCLTSTLSSRGRSAGIAHSWVRTFRGGEGRRPTAAEVVQIADSPASAAAAYNQVVEASTTCAMHQLIGFDRVTGAGDAASLTQLAFPAAGVLHAEFLATARTGVAIVTWVVEPSNRHPMRPSAVIGALAASLGPICSDAAARCPDTHQSITPAPSPADPRAPGMLTTSDLPVFATLPRGWATTPPAPTQIQPASPCGGDDFAASGASDISSRGYVVANAHLPTTFGLTETIATFRRVAETRAFVAQVSQAVADCHKQLSLEVRDSTAFGAGRVEGSLWEIREESSRETSLTYRLCVVSNGRAVAEVVFTPADSYDLTGKQFESLAMRAADRLSQL